MHEQQVFVFAVVHEKQEGQSDKADIFVQFDCRLHDRIEYEDPLHPFLHASKAELHD